MAYRDGPHETVVLFHRSRFERFAPVNIDRLAERLQL